MKLQWLALLAAVVVLLTANSAYPCSVFRSASGEQIPMEMVGRADLILRATAAAYSGLQPGNLRTTGVPDTKVRFIVEEVVKGSYAQKEIVLAGYLSERDDWNDRPVPYDFVRPGGRAGSCFANTYRTGVQFLLVLKKVSGDYTVDWYALGPVNEQLRSESDPWLLWVRKQAAGK